MTRLAAGEALKAGFDVIRRAPAAFAVWVLVDLALGFGPQLLIKGGFGADPARAAQVSPFIVLLTIPLAIFTITVMMSAAFRATLRPEDQRFFYLRVGGDELWLGINLIVMWFLMLAVFVVAVVAFILIAGLVGAVVAGVSSSGDSGGVGAVLILVLLLYVGLFVFGAWGYLRLSLTLPAAFVERRITIAEAWRLSRGNFWRMFGVWLVFAVLTVVAFILLFGSIFAQALGGVPLSELGQRMQTDPTFLSRAMNGGGLTAMLVIYIVLNTALRAAFSGAWADMYRQLQTRPAADVFT